MKSIWGIINAISWQYGISDPRVLEAGRYPPEQARVLYKMQKKCLKSKSANDFHRYIQQKARFLTGY